MQGLTPPLSAQSPPSDSVRIPQWIPADSVNPHVDVACRRDPKTGTWRYTYRVSNRAPARQALTKLGLILAAAVDSTKTSAGWWSVVYNPPALVPGVTFGAEQAANGSWSHAAVPSGPPIILEVFSRAPPGPVEFYARGSTPPLALERLDPVARDRLPSEQSDARRGSTTGPALPLSGPSVECVK